MKNLQVLTFWMTLMALLSSLYWRLELRKKTDLLDKVTDELAFTKGIYKQCQDLGFDTATELLSCEKRERLCKATH